MQPELEQNVVGFESRIRRKQRAPVAVRMLQREKIFGCRGSMLAVRAAVRSALLDVLSTLVVIG